MINPDILTTIISVFAILTALFSLFKSSAERNKLKVETTKLYNDMLNDSAVREQGLKGLIEKLEDKVRALKEIIEKKDARIEELENLSQRQESEIKQLRTELDSLKNKK